MAKIGIIGGGNMGEAILAGIHESHKVFVCEMSFSRRSYLKSKYRCKCVSLEKLLDEVNTIVLATKPQDLGAVLEEIAEYEVEKKLFISIAAGITTEFIEDRLDQEVRVVRTMPNMPALIGEGITALAKGYYAKKSDLEAAAKILTGIGETTFVKEDLIDTITAVSGSGPAYLFYFVECMMKSAKSMGLKDKQAKKLVYQTVIGSVHLLEKGKDSAEVLRKKVTSKGGTTEAALEVMQKNKVDKIFKEALKAAKKRAKELAK